MAQALKPLWALALAALAHTALAQTTIDPTRPPAVLEARAAVAGVAGEGAVSAQPQLQSVLVSRRPGGRRLAVIDGKIVRQGQRVGDAVLVAISSTEVVLRRGGKNETLKLFRRQP
jgi:MSHA biogenesis protein MshK